MFLRGFYLFTLWVFGLFLDSHFDLGFDFLVVVIFEFGFVLISVVCYFVNHMLLCGCLPVQF